MNMESSNFHDRYDQLLQWYKDTDGQTLWEQAPHFNEIYGGAVAIFFRSHARLIEKYRTASDGETTCIGNKKEAEQTAHNALIALFRTIEQGKHAPDPIVFIEQQAWAYFVEMHPAAAYPELWSPEYEKLRKEMIRRLTQKNRASEADAEEAVDLGFEKVFDYARKGNTFDVSLKAYLTTTIFNAFLKRIEKARREPTSNPLPPTSEEDDNVHSGLSEMQDGSIAPDEAQHFANLANAASAEMNNLRPVLKEALIKFYSFKDNFTDADLANFNDLPIEKINELTPEKREQRCRAAKLNLIAQELKITPETLKVRLSEAMMALRQRLALLGYGHFGLLQRGGKQERIFLPS